MEAARRERLRAGFSLEQAARRLRLSAAYLRHIESKNTRVPWSLAVRLAALYDTAAEAFLPVEKTSRSGNTGSRPIPTAGEEAVAECRAADSRPAPARSQYQV